MVGVAIKFPFPPNNEHNQKFNEVAEVHGHNKSLKNYELSKTLIFVQM
jgi:hypothetical protein